MWNLLFFLFFCSKEVKKKITHNIQFLRTDLFLYLLISLIKIWKISICGPQNANIYTCIQHFIYLICSSYSFYDIFFLSNGLLQHFFLKHNITVKEVSQNINVQRQLILIWPVLPQKPKLEQQVVFYHALLQLS